MKRVLSLFVILIIACAAKSQYQVTLQTPNYKSGMAYLTYYYGKNINIEDSALVNSKGVAVFKKNNNLLPGIYSIVFPGKNKLIDFLVDKEQQISITSDTSDLINKTIVTGTKENTLFHQYQKFIATKGKQLQTEQQAYYASKTKNDSVLHQNNYQRLNKELNDYRENIIKQHPSSMLATLFKGMKEAGVINPRPITKQDSITNYNFYKKHYWDGITFMDNRIIRTPFFYLKLRNISGIL